jgi:hypothetical protein
VALEVSKTNKRRDRKRIQRVTRNHSAVHRFLGMQLSLALITTCALALSIEPQSESHRTMRVPRRLLFSPKSAHAAEAYAIGFERSLHVPGKLASRACPIRR